MTVAATEPMPEFHAGAAADEHIAFRCRQDGGYTLAAGNSQLYVGPDAFRRATKYLPALKVWYALCAGRAARLSRRLVDAAQVERGPGKPIRADAHPRSRSGGPGASSHRARIQGAFSTVQVHGSRQCRSGELGGPDRRQADVVPTIDHAPAIPGLVIATGMSGHGFGIGPGMGRVFSDLIQGNDAGHNLRRFRLSRFRDGSAIQLGPLLWQTLQGSACSDSLILVGIA